MPDCGRRRPQRFIYTTNSVRLSRPACYEPACLSCWTLYFRRYPLFLCQRRKRSPTTPLLFMRPSMRRRARMRRIVPIKIARNSAAWKKVFCSSPNKMEESIPLLGQLRLGANCDDRQNMKLREEEQFALRAEKRDKIRSKWEGKRLKLVVSKALYLIISRKRRDSAIS